MKSSETHLPNTAGVSRREALKALVAGGGALAAAAFVPARWARPLVEAGVLPAHAQSSQLVCNYTAQITFVGACPDNIPDCQAEGLFVTFAVNPSVTPAGFSLHFAGQPATILRSDMEARYVVFSLPDGFTSGLVELFLTMPDTCPVYASYLLNDN